MSSSVMPFAALGERNSDGEPSPSSNAVSRRIHLPPNNTSSLEDGRVSLGGQNVQRKESKSGLRGIFSRNKSEKNAVSIVPEETQPTSPLPSPTPLSPKLTSPTTSPVGDGFFRKFAPSNATVSSSPATSAAPVRATKTPSRLHLRSNPVKDRKAASKPEPNTSPNTSVFDPPPLFQSYSQSVKHARLSASTLSADAIIRMSNHKRDTRLRDEIAQTTATGLDQGKEDRKTTSKHKRPKSGSISNSDWTEKIFILVSSGFLLQYSGEGNLDRLPEKMVQLGKESVAFASDVIPGKHWVLQVFQSMNPDGVPTSDSRSLLSRLAFRSPDNRRNATSLLLVLDSAEEMDSWIAVLRKEIEKLGGKRQTTETGTVKTEEKRPELKIQPSHRYLIRRRGSDQVSNPCSPLQRPCDRRTSREQERQTNQGLPLASPTSDEHRRSWPKPEENGIKEPPPPGFLPSWSPNEAQNETAARPLTGCASVTNSASSYEQNLEGLRDSLNRFSYCSSTQRTRISSEATSPARDSPPAMEDPPHLCLETVGARPNAAQIVERRRSLQAMQGLLDPIPQKSSPRLQTSQQTLRHSSYGATSRPIRCPSPATPNFSVPVPSSKRFLARSSVAGRRPSLPALNTTMEAQNRSKEGPPAALPGARLLSPVFDATSPKRIPMPATSVETSHRPVLQHQLSANDIQLGSPERLPVRKCTLPRSRRVTNLLALDDALEGQNTDVRRHPSMQEARQILPPMKSNQSLKVPEPLSLKMSHGEAFDNIREDQWGSSAKLQESSTQARPLPTLSEIPLKQSSLRRPRSMLASSSLQSRTTEEMSNTPRRKRPYSTLAPTTIPLTFDDEKTSRNRALSTRGVQSGRGGSNRRSMQAFMYGAPLSPPPDYALPPLPAGYASNKSSGPSFVTSREEIGARI